jgi:HAD superfamily hydrolase (TIGR01549 family)
MRLPEVEGLLFDLDDTITDFRSASDIAFSTAFGEVALEHEVPVERMRQVYMDLFEEYYTMHLQGLINLEEFRVYRFSRMFEILGLPVDERFLDMCVCFEEVYEEALQTFPGAMETLIELEKVYPMGLISNGPTDAQWFKIEKFHLDDIFDVVLVSGQIGMAKPDPNIFYVAMSGIRSEPSSTVMVGNSLEHDFRGAMNAGCRFVWANHLREPLPDGWPQPLAIVNNLPELKLLFL